MNSGKLKAFWAALALASGPAFGGEVELITEALPRLNPATAAGFSANATYSPDGKFILFSSTAQDLVASPEINKASIFLLRTADSSLSLVSVAQSGVAGNGASIGASISADNSFVVFQSDADNLGAADTNRTADIYWRNLTTLQTGLVSHNAGNTGAGNRASMAPEVSRDGAWVVFETEATDLVAADPGGGRDIMAWRRSDGALHLVSADRFGVSTNGDYDLAGITADSRSVLFAGNGPKLTADGVTSGELYLHDLAAGTNRLVGASVAAQPGLETASLSEPRLSGDGRYVFATATQATAPKPVLVRINLADDSVTLVATNAATEPFTVSVSDDGNFAAFSRGTNVFRWSATGGLELVDVEGVVGPRSSNSPEISRDGSKVAFISNAQDLIPGIGEGEWQVYVRDMASGNTRLVTHKVGAVTPSERVESTYFEFSPDGNTLLFETGADDIVDLDINAAFDIFKFDVATGDVSVVSQSRNSEPVRTARNGGFTGRPNASDDGRYVAFVSRAQLSVSDTNAIFDAYVRDRQTRATILVSVNTNGLAAGNVENVMVSGDGRKVLYDSSTPGQGGPEDTRPGRSVFLRDLDAGTTRNISVGTGTLHLRDWSRNGRYAFIENETAKQLLRVDIQENVSLVISGGAGATFPFVTATSDGSRVMYYKGGAAFRQELPNGAAQSLPPGLFAWSGDGESAAIAVSSTAAPGLLITNFVSGEGKFFAGIVRAPSISAHGEIVAYESLSGPGTNRQICYYSAATGQTGLVTHAMGTTSASFLESRSPVVSASGRFIAYESWADDLVPDDGNILKDVFIFDVATGQNQLASHRFGSAAAANSISVNPVFAGATDLVLFQSFASDFVDGDLNEGADLFVVAPAVGNVFRILRVELPGNGARRIVWESTAGNHYIVQAKDRLEDAWTQVGEVSSATGSESSITDSADKSTQYYRVVMAP